MYIINDIQTAINAKHILFHTSDIRDLLTSTSPMFIHKECPRNCNKCPFARECRNFYDSDIISLQKAIKNTNFPTYKRQQSCAVIGSSASMLLHKAGKRIDNHDIVIRSNHAITSGYEKFVGYKTNIRVWGSLPLPRQTNFSTQSEHLLISCPPVNWVGQCWKNILNDGDVRLHPNLWKKIKEYTKFFPSTGFMSVMFALTICDKVHVFGFGSVRTKKCTLELETPIPARPKSEVKETCWRATYCGRYYETNFGNCMKQWYFKEAIKYHNFSRELILLRRLQRRRYITMN